MLFPLSSAVFPIPGAVPALRCRSRSPAPFLLSPSSRFDSHHPGAVGSRQLEPPRASTGSALPCQPRFHGDGHPMGDRQARPRCLKKDALPLLPNPPLEAGSPRVLPDPSAACDGNRLRTHWGAREVVTGPVKPSVPAANTSEQQERGGLFPQPLHNPLDRLGSHLIKIHGSCVMQRVLQRGHPRPCSEGPSAGGASGAMRSPGPPVPISPLCNTLQPRVCRAPDWRLRYIAKHFKITLPFVSTAAIFRKGLV